MRTVDVTPAEYAELKSKHQIQDDVIYHVVEQYPGTQVVYLKEPKGEYVLNSTCLLAKDINPTKFISTINKLEIKDDDGNTHTYSLIDILDGLTAIAKKAKEQQ